MLALAPRIKWLSAEQRPVQLLSFFFFAFSLQLQIIIGTLYELGLWVGGAGPYHREAGGAFAVSGFGQTCSFLRIIVVHYGAEVGACGAIPK